MPAVPVDMSGQVFGRLTVVRYVKPGRWECLCQCGAATIVRAMCLKKGFTRSCGCLRREKTIERGIARAKHRMHETRTYRSWTHMRERCNNPSHHAYKYYGARGISVCERWNDFLLFLEDMGERPANTSLDRINVNGNYEPTNCRWASPLVQAQNRRTRKEMKHGTTRI